MPDWDVDQPEPFWEKSPLGKPCTGTHLSGGGAYRFISTPRIATIWEFGSYTYIALTLKAVARIALVTASAAVVGMSEEVDATIITLIVWTRA